MYIKNKRKIILALCLVLAIILTLCVTHNLNKHTEAKNTKTKEVIKKVETPVKEEINIESEQVNEIQEEQVAVQEPIQDTYTTRMTSFWANDGYGTGDCTGSGLCSWDFGINEKGWYTYNGKLVVATATTYLANQGWYVADGVHLYKYWEELVLTIDGVEYDSVILDSCGNCMKTDRVDLFVSNGASARDTTIQVRRK